jgi:hypothetical protein
VQLDLQDQRVQQDLLVQVEERRVQLEQLEQWVLQEHLVRQEVSGRVDLQVLREQLV